jgi:hypothetical protein
VNLPRFEIGEYVLVSMTDDQLRSTPKPLRRWQGPFRIVGFQSEWVLQVEDLIHRKKVDVHISRVRFYCDKHLDVTDDLIQQYAHDCQRYEVEKFLDLREVDGRLELLVAWKGFEEDDTSWEPVSRLVQDVPHLCKSYKVDKPHLEAAYKRFLKQHAD